MQEQLNNLEKKFNELNRTLGIVTGEYQLLKENYTVSQYEIEEYKKSIELYKKCVELIQLVQGLTRERVKKQFEDLVTSGLRFVFGEGYYFELEFGRRGSLAELDFKIITPEHNEACDPMMCESGGILDLVSLILRVVIMECYNPKINGFILLDESLKCLDKNRLPKAIEFIKQLSEKLNRQVIFITHSNEIIESGFNTIEIK